MPEYKKVIYSGFCLCGHHANTHHGQMVANPEAAKIIGPRYPGTCLAFGFNETAGCGPDGEEEHCWKYVDKDNPDEELKKLWTGTYRPPKNNA